MTDAPNDETEPDIESESAPVELKLEQETPRRRISLNAGDQHVEIEAPDDLDVVASLAASLWLLTSPPRTVRMGFSAGSTLITDLAGDNTADRGEEEP